MVLPQHVGEQEEGVKQEVGVGGKHIHVWRGQQLRTHTVGLIYLDRTTEALALGKLVFSMTKQKIMERYIRWESKIKKIKNTSNNEQ